MSGGCRHQADERADGTGLLALAERPRRHLDDRWVRIGEQRHHRYVGMGGGQLGRSPANGQLAVGEAGGEIGVVEATEPLERPERCV